MPGERYSKLTLRASWSADRQIAYFYQTYDLRFTLGGIVQRFTLDTDIPGTIRFVVPQPTAEHGDRQYMVVGMANLIAALRTFVVKGGNKYLVSDPRDLGDDPATGYPIFEFDITALDYEPIYNLDFSTYAEHNPTLAAGGWEVVSKLAGLRPVEAMAIALPAGIYGSATGSVSLFVLNGNGAPYTYVWSDANAPKATDVRERDDLLAGTYRITVTDQGGVSTVVVAVVGQDPRLVVTVNATSNSVQLVASGGLPPYTYLWEDGDVTPARTGLVPGTYRCRVTDARGAIADVEVVLSDYRFYWSQNPIPLALDAGAAYRLDPTTKPNLTFLCEVWLEKEYLSDVFEQVGTTLEQPADRDGRTVFDVQALLAAFLEPHVPAPDATAVELAEPLFRRFYLKHAESFGVEPVAVPAVALERNFVVLGGLNFYENRARTWFTSYQAQVRPFLTWEPPTKPVLADQPEFLYFMVQQAPASFRCQVRVHLSTGQEHIEEHPGADDVANFEVYCLPVGYVALGLAHWQTATERVLWWEVFVTTADGTTVLSETRRFVLDTRAFPQRRYFLFATSLGGMATYAALGEAQLDQEATGTEAARTLAPDYDVLAGDTAVQARQLRAVLKVASGPRTRAQLLASQDLLLSKRVLLLSGARWLPGFIKAKTATLLDESKAVLTQEFEFYLPTERLYTPLLGEAQVTTFLAP